MWLNWERKKTFYLAHDDDANEDYEEDDYVEEEDDDEDEEEGGKMFGGLDLGFWLTSAADVGDLTREIFVHSGHNGDYDDSVDPAMNIFFPVHIMLVFEDGWWVRMILFVVGNKHQEKQQCNADAKSDLNLMPVYI